jgi:hypothetical protein
LNYIAARSPIPSFTAVVVSNTLSPASGSSSISSNISTGIQPCSLQGTTEKDGEVRTGINSGTNSGTNPSTAVPSETQSETLAHEQHVESSSRTTKEQEQMDTIPSSHNKNYKSPGCLPLPWSCFHQQQDSIHDLYMEAVRQINLEQYNNLNQIDK